MIDAFRTLFALPPPVVECWSEERQRLKMDVHEYVSHLLFQRYEQLSTAISRL